jgi:hypothetical protein
MAPLGPLRESRYLSAIQIYVYLSKSRIPEIRPDIRPDIQPDTRPNENILSLKSHSDNLENQIYECPFYKLELFFKFFSQIHLQCFIKFIR